MLPLRSWQRSAMALAMASGIAAGCATGSDQRADRELQKEINRERSVGRAAVARLAHQYGLRRDEASTAYLNLVVASIAAISARPELEYHAAVLDTDEANAFALPGGYILITRGAVAQMQSEAELVGVLAHEVAHVVLRHSGEYRNNGGFMELFAGIIGGGGFLTGAIESSAEALHKTLLENGRQKELELDADRAGALYAAQLGYEPRAMVAYLKRTYAARSGEALSRTHPGLSERMRTIETFSKTNNLSGNAGNSNRFAEFRRRTIVR